MACVLFGANPLSEPSLYIMMKQKRVGFVIGDLSLIPCVDDDAVAVVLPD